MQLDKKQTIKNIKKYIILVNNYLVCEKIILFGSYSNDSWNENSDVDIAIIVKKMPDDFLSILKELNKLTRDIDYRIEPVLIEENDDRSGFLTTILQTGITLYERKEKLNIA